VIGPNGSGKTTLLSTLLGETDADSGEIRWGSNLNIGYYDQRLDDFDPEDSVIEAAWEDRDVKEQQVRDVLATMLFRGEDVNKPVQLLSGGERARLRLSQLLLDKPNVFVLDEPTNHLDIPSREALEAALASFEGTILCVSHDRYFLEKVARRLLILAPPDVVDFPGRYSQWVQRLAQEAAADTPAESARSRAKATVPASVSRDPGRKKDNPYARPFGRLTLEELELQITDTEIGIAECQETFGDPEAFKDPNRGQNYRPNTKLYVKSSKPWKPSISRASSRAGPHFFCPSDHKSPASPFARSTYPVRATGALWIANNFSDCSTNSKSKPPPGATPIRHAIREISSAGRGIHHRPEATGRRHCQSIHRLLSTVAVHVLWDFSMGVDANETANYARKNGVRIGSVNQRFSRIRSTIRFGMQPR